MATLNGRDVAARIFLGIELCVVVLAASHSLHATLTTARLQSLSCDDGTPCPQPLTEAKRYTSSPSPHHHQSDVSYTPLSYSLVTSGLALAVLSAVVFLARLAVLPLRHFPRTVGLVYDMLLSVLWILGLAHLLLARDTARQLSNGSAVAADGAVSTCWALRGVAMAGAAAAFYSVRLLYGVAVVFGHVASREYRPMDMEDAEGRMGEKSRVVVRAPQAYSPVLAFFPDD